tara:strand:+ start:6713 stop:8683 length:1971 start_codon:yes stop_codon:yes gene_type:complete
MATKGGSLLGKADATLSRMSYLEAMADVTPDYGKVYQAEALNQALFQKGIEDHFNTLHADYNALGDELKEATTAMMANLSAGTTPDEAGMEMFNNELNTLRERLKAAPKGKKGDLERAKIRAELGRLKNSTEGMDQTLTTLGTMIENDQFDALATGQDLPLLLAISKGEATKKIENGNLVYSIPNPAGGDDITMTQQDLKEALVLKDPKFTSEFNKIHAGFNAIGKQKGTTWEEKRQGAVNSYENIFTTKHAFATTISNKQGGMDHSFLEALTSGKSDVIYKTLMEMGSEENFYNGYDVDQDGDVDAQDFANPENGAKLINALTNIKDKENFDFQTAKKVAAEFYADGLAKSEFDDGTRLRKTGGGDDDEKLEGFDKWLKGVGSGTNFGITPSKGKIGNWYNKSSIRDIYTDMLTGKFSFEGFLYTFENGVWKGEDNRPKLKNGKDNPNFGNIETIGNQETFVRNKLNQRNSVWTQAEISSDFEEVDYKTGETKKEKGGKYGSSDWDEGGTTNINIDTLIGDDITIAENLNKQMPTGNLNPMGYKWSTDGSWSEEVFLLDANNNRISWEEIFGTGYNHTFRNTDKYGRKARGSNIHLSTSSESLNDKRNEMQLMLDILKRIKYTTTDGKATNLYDNFQPLGATSGGDTSGINTSDY